MSSATKLFAGPDGAAIDITVRSTDCQAAERWIAAFQEAHDLRERPPARPKGTSLERAIARAFPLLGWTMKAFMAAAVVVVIACLAGLVEPEHAGAYIGRLFMLAGPLVAFVIVLIGVEARIRRPDAGPRLGGKRRIGVHAAATAIVFAASALLLSPKPAPTRDCSGGCGEVTGVINNGGVLADGPSKAPSAPSAAGTDGPQHGSSCIVLGTPGVFECSLDSMMGSVLNPPADVDSGMVLHSEGRGELTVTGSCTPAASGPLVPSSRGTILPADPLGDEPELPLLPPLTEEGLWVRSGVATERRA
jgi:hypothetical protein